MEKILVDSVGPGGRAMVLAEVKEEPEVKAEQPKKPARKKKTDSGVE